MDENNRHSYKDEYSIAEKILDHIIKSKTISIVIPALNEKDGIVRTIQSIPKTQLENMGYKVQILIVDNGSTDGTGELAQKAGAEVILEPKRGYGSAFKAGFASAGGDIIATADADLTYPAEEIPRLVKILTDENIDFITTNRFGFMEKNAMSFRNKVGNRVLALETRTLFNLNITDPESGMWVFRKDILTRLQLGSNTWPFSHEIKIEACDYAKCRWKEVPIKYRILRLGGRLESLTFYIYLKRGLCDEK
jgi:glycosyltransferase involved in cell wall biosynthesis